MIPWQLLGEAPTPDGNAMTLTRRGNDYMIMADGKDLMSSQMKGSEEALATIGCDRAKHLEGARVLVGGLGMGFTLRAALDTLAQDATVVVAELMPAVLEWNRGILGPLAGNPLDDRRTQVELCDVASLLRASRNVFDAILLDTDNGPAAFTQEANSGLYDNNGLTMIRNALRPSGVLAVWSAWDDRKFEHRLKHHGYAQETHHVRARLKQGGKRHTIFVGRL
jgi:spermidine synthase